MDRSKFVTEEELLLIKQDVKNQVILLNEELANAIGVQYKKEIENVSVMTEVGDTNGDE